jgi:outer membrane protein assembly factor BamB
VALATILGLALVPAAYYLLPFAEDFWSRWYADPTHRKIDNAIRLLVAEGIFIGSLAVGFYGTLWVAGVSRRKFRLALAAPILALVAFLATFQPRWRGDMQHSSWEPRPWMLRVARSAGMKFDSDVLREARLAETSLSIDASGDDWPEFLGTSVRNSTAPARGFRLAEDWAKEPPREIWRTKVGRGWSSFAIVGHYGFTQEQTTDDSFEQVVCYDVTNGKVQWVQSDPGGYDWQLGGKGPRATPLVRDGKVVAQGSNGIVNCLEAGTGKLLWKHNLVEELGTDVAMWGKATSPLAVTTKAHGDVVVIAAGVKEGEASSRSASLLAYRLADGREVWRGGTFASGYCSPELVTLGGVPQIVMTHWQTVAGHDPETGAVLWTFDNWPKGQPKVPQPIVIDDQRVLVSAGYGVGCRMIEVAKGADGKWNVKELWKSTRLKPKFTNLVVHGGHVYGIDDGEFFVCLDLADGKMKWRSPRSAHFGHGQPLLVGDLILIQTEDGELVLAAADPNEYRELGRVPVLTSDTTSWNAPALWGQFILCRNDLEAACFKLPIVSP